MGGQHGFWGLWLDSEYGLGESSESCTTFKDYTLLSAVKNFKIRNVEVWGVGPEPKLDEDDVSVLSNFPSFPFNSEQPIDFGRKSVKPNLCWTPI
jgi:hypothetical protein